jgi:hypothetical protein
MITQLGDPAVYVHGIIDDGGSMTSLDSYFDALCARLPDQAERVGFHPVAPGGWQPKRNDCHANVKAFVEGNPEYRPVRGWVVNTWLLDAHSVVCDEEGTLWDITFPDLAAQGILFIRHDGTDEEFLEIRNLRSQHICVNTQTAVLASGQESALSPPDVPLFLPEDDLND